MACLPSLVSTVHKRVRIIKPDAARRRNARTAGNDSQEDVAARWKFSDLRMWMLRVRRGRHCIRLTSARKITPGASGPTELISPYQACGRFWSHGGWLSHSALGIK